MKGLRAVVSFCLLLKARSRQWDTMFTQTHRGDGARRQEQEGQGQGSDAGTHGGDASRIRWFGRRLKPVGDVAHSQASRNGPNRLQDPETPGNPWNQAQGAHRIATALYSVTWFEPSPGGPSRHHAPRS